MSLLQPQTPLPRRGAPGTSWAARTPEMKPMSAMGDRDWTWDQPRRFSSYYELRASGEPIAILNQEAGLSPLRPFHATTAEGEWIIKRRHLLLHAFDVRRPGEDAPAATFQPGWFGRGRLTLPTGREYGWKLESFWQFEWGWTDSGNSPLMLLRPVFAFARARAHVEVTGAVLRLPELPVLAVLGWLLMLTSRRHAH